MLHFVVDARSAEERHEDQTEHVKRRQPRGNESDQPQPGRMLKRFSQNLILAEKARQRRNPRDRKRPREESFCRCRNLRPERAHLAHILLAGERVNHAAGAEEEQRLEKRVRHQVENPRRKRAHTHRQKHVTELADGGICEHALDVVLQETHRGRVDRGQCADHRHDFERRGSKLVERVHPRDHVHARRHHCRRMDQRAHRRRAFHRVRQPNVQWNLRRLTRRADKEKQPNRRQHRRSQCKRVARDTRGQRLYDPCEPRSLRQPGIREPNRPQRHRDKENA